MVELIIFSVIAGILVKGWNGKLFVFPAVIAIYATLRAYFSPKARIVRENRKLEGRGSGLGNYTIAFVYKFIISAVITGLTGLIRNLFR